MKLEPKTEPESNPVGDASAIEEAYEAHGVALYRYGRLLCGSHHDAEDLVQAAFVALARAGREHLERPRDAQAFLFAAAHNEAVNLLQKRDLWRNKVAPNLPSFVVARSESSTGPSDPEAVGDLNAGLAALGLEQREALGLRYFEELTFEQIGKALNIPAATAASRCRLGLEHLRHLLRKE